MSFNTDPGRAARRHPAAIIAIVIALAAAGVALVWWMGADPAAENDVSRIESPEAPEGGAARTAATPDTPEPIPTPGQPPVAGN